MTTTADMAADGAGQGLGEACGSVGGRVHCQLLSWDFGGSGGSVE
jgi:hypothetical protein